MTQQAERGPTSGLPRTQPGPPNTGISPQVQPGQPSNDQFTNAAFTQSQAGTANVNQQTQDNRVNQTNPFGSAQWSKDPSTGQWTQNVSLSGQQGDALQSQQGIQAGRSQAAQGLLGQATTNLSSPIDQSGFTKLFSFGSPGQTNQQAQDAVMGQVQPMIDQQGKALDVQLANQGITPGSEAYRNAHDQQSRGDNNLRLQAVQAGFQQGNTQNTQNINYGRFQEGQNDFQYQRAQNDRNQPLADINSLTQGQNVQAPNYLGAAQSQYNQLLDQNNASAAKQASLYGGLFSLGGAALGSQAGQAAIGKAGDWLGSYFGG